jgi:hypothetical protein
MDWALTLIARGRPVKRVCDVLGVARSNVADKLSRPPDWRDGRTARQTGDAGLVEEIRRAIADLPSYGYRRAWDLLRPQRENRRGVEHVAAYCAHRCSAHALWPKRQRPCLRESGCGLRCAPGASSLPRKPDRPSRMA